MLTGPDFHDFSRGSVMPTAAGETCFLCGQSCSDPGWVWDGERTEPLFLHLSCALKLQMNINRDLAEYHKKTGTEPKST
jgi:hypothetical protein